MFKRTFLLLLVFSFFVTFPAQPCLAAPTTGQTIGVVIIGDGALDFKGDDFYTIIREGLKPKFGNVVVGDEAQGKWRNFWDSKGYLTEQPPKRDDLFDFSKGKFYDKILFLVVLKPALESSKFSMYVDIHRATLDIRAMLIQEPFDSLAGDKSTVQKDSSDSSITRAKRGALTKAIDFFAKSL